MMKFWICKVKIGEIADVHVPDGMLLHLTGATLGQELLRGDEIHLSLTYEGKTRTLKTLHPSYMRNCRWELVLDKDFKLHHSSDSGSVTFMGYFSANPEVEDNKSASDEDSDSDEDEVTLTPPVQVKSSRKRASVSTSNKHVREKKLKLITPKKIDGKKGSVHVAAPYPSKQAGKTLANKPNQLIPKIEGSHPCKSCHKIFKSEQAVEAHFKAKHSGGQ